MKRAEFVEILADKVSLPKKQTAEVVEAFWDLILEIIKRGDDITFNHGKFLLKKKPAREATNPRTGEKVKVEAKVVPQFKPAKKFKDGVIA